MKKLLFLFLFAAVFILSAAAQIKKGSVYLGGNLGGSTLKSTTGASGFKQKGLTISPVFGKAVKDNLIAGVSAEVQLNTAKNDVNQTSKNRGYGGGVFIRKYRNIGAGGFFIFLHGGLTALHQKNEAYNGLAYNTSKVFTTGINAFPGIAYNLSRKLQLESGFAQLFAVNYTRQKNTVRDQAGTTVLTTSHALNLNTSLENGTSSFYVGFRLLLNK